MQFTLLLETLDDGINVLPYLSITTRLDDGFVKDTVGLVHLHHAVVVDAEAQQGGKPHDKKQVVAPTKLIYFFKKTMLLEEKQQKMMF